MTPPPNQSSSLSSALAEALSMVRAELSDSTSAVAVITQANANAVLARRALSLAGPYLRVHFMSPSEVERDLSLEGLSAGGLRREPEPWLEALLSQLVPDLARRGLLAEYGEVLVRPGWIPSLANAIRRLESALWRADEIRACSFGEGDEARAELLATLLQEVARNRAEEGLYGPLEQHRVAMQALENGGGTFTREIRGAIVLGDRSLPYGVFTCLTAWLARLPKILVLPAPFGSLPAAPFGLREAAEGSTTLLVKSNQVGSRRLDLIRDRVFKATPLGGEGAGVTGAPGVPGDGEVAVSGELSSPGSEEPTISAADGSLEIVSVPDEVVEAKEALRVVMEAIRLGVPLERIAIAVPDNRAIDVLESLTESLKLEACFLVGSPLSRHSAARLLSKVLALANGDQSLTRWHDLLRTPGLLRRGELANLDLSGSGRWRRILARCGAHRGTQNIIRAVRSYADKLEDDQDTRVACQNLVTAMESFVRIMAELPDSATLSVHAGAWRDFLSTHQPWDNGLKQLLDLFDSWGSREVGPVLERAQAASLLEAKWAEVQQSRGKLTGGGIVVAPPMALLGGDFDLVCVLGLTQGRFPPEAREDVLLTDQLIDRLNRRHGARLTDSRGQPDAERRRFASPLASCRERLWLSIPRIDALDDSPLVPSSLLLEVGSALLGGQCSYRDLTGLVSERGQRPGSTSFSMSDALTLEEWLLAWMDAEPEEAVRALTLHPWARGQLQLFLSQERLRQSIERGEAPQFDAWTGLIDPKSIPDPVLGSQAAPARDFAKAVRAPASYLATSLLGAWPAPRIADGANLVDRDTIARRVLQSLEAVVEPVAGEELASRLTESFEESLDEALLNQPEVSESRRTMARRLGKQIIDELFAGNAELATGPAVRVEQARLAEDLPWMVKGELGHRVEDDIFFFKSGGYTKPTLANDPEAFIQALATVNSGQTVERLVNCGFEGGVKATPFEALADDTLKVARETYFCASQGLWPPNMVTSKSKWREPLALKHDPEIKRSDLVALLAERDGGEV